MTEMEARDRQLTRSAALASEREAAAHLIDKLHERLREMEGALVSIAHTFTEDSHGNMKTYPAGYYQDIARKALAHPAESEAKHERWPIGTLVEKIKGASWRGQVVGYYTTSLTPEGYCVESEREPGSVQIYPRAALTQPAESGAEALSGLAVASERERAILLANTVLDRANGDPDDDLAVLARQLLRALERLGEHQPPRDDDA